MRNHLTLMSSILGLIFVLLMGGTPRLGWSQVQPEGQPGPYATGARPMTPHEQAWMDKHARKITHPIGMMDLLPARVVNHLYLPMVGNQGMEGSCTHWAATYYYKTWQEAREHGWEHPDSAVNPERVMNHQFSFQFDAFPWHLFLDHGAVTYAAMQSYGQDRWPSEAQWRAAIPYRAQSIAQIDYTSADGIAALKEHLAEGDLAWVALLLHNNFTSYPAGEGIDNEVYYSSQGGVYVPPNYLSPDHALTLIGYDDNKEYFDGVSTRKGAFLLVNSWGTNWGVSLPEVGTPGFIWISYDYFQNSSWGTATIMEDRIGYQPTDFVVVEFHHGRLLELDASVVGGDRDNPEWTCHFLDFGGDRPVNGRLVGDLTGYPVCNTLTYWLNISDVDLPNLFSPPETGWFTYFAIERSDRPEPWVSEDTPVQSVETNIVKANAWAHVGLLEDRGELAEGEAASQGTHSWGDYDRDGDLDLAYCGFRDGQYVTRVLRNDGEDGLVDIHADLPGMIGQVQWVDMNGDGLLDLLLAGWSADASFNYTNYIDVYANQGFGVFSRIPSGLPSIEAKVATLDMDNDGDLDLAILDHTNHFDNGDNNNIYFWKNDGKGYFTDSGIRTDGPRYGNGSLACADYDRDGDIDLAVNGSWFYSDMSVSFDEMRIWRNDGGAFTLAHTLDGAFAGNLAWGDVDNDGWMDLAATVGESVAVYRNQDGTVFSRYATLPALARYGSIVWGDLTNDGLADIALTHDLGYPRYETKVYRNNGDGTFYDVQADMPGITYGNVQLLDFDQDGDLDISIMGGQAPVPYTPVLSLIENHAAQSQGLGRVNAAPSTPTGLGETLSGVTWHLTWNPASDTETAASGLYYNMRVGSRPGWSDLVSGEIGSPLLGNRLRPTLPSGSPGLVLKKTPSQCFYWSVQAIDSGLRASAWSEPRLIRPAGASLPGDVNADGKIDIADLVACVNVVNGGAAPSPLTGDCNGDGALDLIDLYHINAALLGQAAPGMNVLAIKKIGPEGGKLIADGFNLTIPAGAFTEAVELTLYQSTLDTPFGADSASPCFHVSGLPQTFNLPLQVKIAATAATSDATVLGVGTIGYVPSEAAFRRGFRPFEPSTVSGEEFTFEIPAATAGWGVEGLAQAGGGTLAAGVLPAFTLEIVDTWFGLGTRQVIMHGPHFDITFPVALNPVEVGYLLEAFETAYDTLKDPTDYGFSYTGAPAGKIPVVVKDLGPDRYGAYFNPPGTAFDCIEINSKDVTASARTTYQATACHEFFHLVQALYTPGANMYYSLPYRSLWLDEACSVWSEHITVPGEISTVFDNNITESFRGLVAGAAGKEQDHGYGMAALIKYFVDRRVVDKFPLKVYQQLKANKSTVEAIQSAGGQTDFLWWTEYLESLISGELYGFNMMDVQKAAPADRRFDLSTANLDGSKSFGCELPDLSGQLHMTKVNKSGLPADAVLSHRLRTGEKLKLSAFEAKSPATISSSTRGVEVKNGVKLDYPLSLIDPNEGWNILVLATNYRAVAPYTTVTNCGLDVAVTWNRTYPLSTTTVKDTAWNDMPTLTLNNGTVKGRGLTNVSVKNSGGLAFLLADAIGEPPLDLEISIPFQVTVDSVTVPSLGSGSSSFEIWSTTGIKYYLFDRVLHQVEESPDTVTSNDGKFTLPVDVQSEFAGGPIYAYYDVKVESYDGVNPIPTSTQINEDQWMPVAYVGITP